MALQGTELLMGGKKGKVGATGGRTRTVFPRRRSELLPEKAGNVHFHSPRLATPVFAAQERSAELVRYIEIAGRPE